jgi:septal ring-binding cell division protein DamX
VAVAPPPAPVPKPETALAGKDPAPVAAPIPAPSPAPEPGASGAAAELPAPAPLAEPALAKEQLRLFTTYPAGANALVRERMAATRERLLREPDASHTIELFVTDSWDPARLERFLLRARDLVPLENVFAIPMHGPRRYRIRVVYGAYSTKEAAAEAAKRLPPRYLDAFGLMPLSFADLRRDMK